MDADHIRIETVARFLPHADFYTIDVADWIGKPVVATAVAKFVAGHPELMGRISIPGIEQPLEIVRGLVECIASKYLPAVQEAGKIYRHIARAKGEGNFITEVSLDETDSPQTPPELLVILAALAGDGIPAQTIAPKVHRAIQQGH